MIILCFSLSSPVLLYFFPSQHQGYHPPPGYGHPQHPSGYYDHYGNQHHHPNDYGASMYNVQTGGMGDRLPESNDLSGTEGISPTPVRMSKEDHDGHRVDRASSPQE
mmetsp:Transcript_792/g.1092  ORF Transcript_792/g.1092 Transcript_792/m.1092 type:complete len:107 (+) Transcript_792:1-321(+)